MVFPLYLIRKQDKKGMFDVTSKNCDTLSKKGPFVIFFTGYNFDGYKRP